MTWDEIQDLRRGDPLVYIGPHTEHELFPVRWWGYAITTGQARVRDGSMVMHTRIELLRRPTPEELLTVEWPATPGVAS